MMQWLIDICVKRILDEIHIPPVFVNRGDPALWDFEDADFVTDGTWQEMDLSGIIPLGTKAIAVWCYVLDDLVDSYIQFKTRGNDNNINSSQLRTQVANIIMSADLIIIPNPDRLIQFRASDTSFTNIRFIVKGWWL